VSFFLHKIGEQVRTGAWGDGISGRGEKVGKEYKYCVHMNINGKMIPVDTVPGMGEEA
jgi:hypothetical protein